MTSANRHGVSKMWALAVVIALLASSLIALWMTSPQGDAGLGATAFPDEPGTHPLGSSGDDPRPTGTTLFPWPMQLHDELHRSYTSAPAPDSSAVLWSNATGPSTYGSPSVADGKVFIGARTPIGDRMFAFHQDNGTQAWSTPTVQPVSGGLGVTSSPAYSDGLVVFGGDRIYCLWASNGTVKWTVNTGNRNWGDGTPTIADGKVFIGGSDRKLYAIDLDTGTVLWTHQTLSILGTNYGLYSAPAIYNGHAYLPACDGWVYQILIDQPGPIAVVNHSYNTGSSMYGSPVIFDNKVYIGNGYTFNNVNNRFYALDATDLSLVWEFYPGSGTSFLGSAAIAYDKLFVGSVDGNLYVLDPYGGGGSTTIIWQYSIGQTWSSPAVSSGKVFIGSKSNFLYAFDVNQTGPPTYLWRYNTNGNVDSSPAIADGVLFIGSHGNGGMIYAFGQGGDVISPFPISVSPTGTGVPVNTDIVVVWSEVMDWTSVEASFSYTDMSTIWTSADGTFNHYPVNRTSIFNPFVDLDFSTTYWVTFSSVAIDLAGNPLDGDGNGAGGDDLVWSFDTVIDNSPSLNLWEPGSTSGQSYTVGTMVLIVWEASDDASWPNGGNVINLTYGVSPFGGTTISQYELEDGSFNWDTTGEPLGTYYVNVTAYDSLGQVSGSYSNFSFDIVAIPDSPPTVSLTAPVGGLSWSGGTSINIDWTMSDDITLVQNLNVYLNYSSSSGSGPIAGPLTGLSSPSSYPWALPLLDATDVVVLIDVIDESGNVGFDSSAQFEVDSTPPILDSHSPWIDETNVATNANINIEWREGMNAAATEASFSLQDNATWTLVSAVFSWGGPNITMSFNPDADLAPNSWYTANFTTAAKDDSQPGNNLAFYSWSFLTAAVPDSLPPEITNIQASPSPQEVFFPVWINASITDLYGIAEAHVEVFDPSLALIGNFTMQYDSGNDYFFARNYDMLGVHNCTISSMDNNGNWAQTSSGCSFEMADNTAPQISNILKVPSPVEIFNIINISASVTDNYAVLSVNLDIVAVDNFIMTIDPGSGRYYHEHECQMLGPHDFTITASDTSGNLASEQGQFYAMDTEPPQIVHTPPSRVEVGSTIDFQATVTDNYMVDSVWLNYTDASSIHFNVSMTSLPGNVYQLTLPVQNQAGQVVYHIYAKDLATNGAVTAVLQVSVVDTTDDLAPMPPWGLVAEEGPNGVITVLSWSKPVLNEDMTLLDDLAGYHVYRSESETGQKTRINPVLVETTAFIDDDIENGKTYYYWVTAIDESANESDFSTPADISFGSEATGVSYDIILILLAIIITVVLLIAVLLWRKKKGEASEEQQVEDNEEPTFEEETELE
ncbi:MAG: PQQ-binding-like beta-propeller repeat protein [Thermoplasmata archaeon]|nr:PQQ-binding-like beta-propeller repeat protein [Thermoplasmata archaeon]